MSIQPLFSIPRLVSAPMQPAAQPIAQAMATAPVQAPVAQATAAAQPFSWAPQDLIAGLKKGLNALGRFALSPLMAIAGQRGVDLFVRPGMGSFEGNDPSAWGLKFETLNFPSKDGTPLKGWYMPAATPTDKTIVLAHGHAGNMSDVLYRWGPWLHKAGYNVMAFDFRNSGASGGSKTTMGFEERFDLDAALTQVQAKGAKHIAVMGLSMGGATALSQAANDPRIEAIVADSSFDTIEHAVESRSAKATFDIGPFKGLHIPFQKWSSQAVVDASERATGHTEHSPGGSLRSADPIHAMAKLQDRPLFLIHGAEDTDTLPNNSEALAKAAPHSQLWLVPGAAHGDGYKMAKQEYQARVLDFLQRSF